MNKAWWVGPVIGTTLLVIFLIIPPLHPITPLGMKVVGIFFFTGVWWATVSTGYPSIICLVLVALLGVLPVTQLFNSSFGWWITLFFLGSCGLTMGLRATGFSRRFALWFISRRFVAGHPWRLVGMYLVSVTLLGSVMTGAATSIVSVAVAEPMLEALGYRRGDRFAATFMMGVAWAATASLLMTPFGHAGNIVAIQWIKRDFGYDISFLHFLLFGIPTGIFVLAMLLLVFRYLVNPDVSRIKELGASYIAEEVRKLGPMKLDEKIAVGVFLFVIAWWLLPSFFSTQTVVGAYLDRTGIAIPALAGASLLCFIRVRGKPVITFDQWLKDGVEWGTYALIAAIGIISVIISNPDTGIQQFVDNIFRPVAQAVPFTIFLFITIALVTILTNAMSNLASQTLVYTVMMPIALAVGKGNPALAVLISAASNMAFSLPSATPSTAIVTGSGWVPVPFMLRYGLLLLIPVVLIFSFVVYPYALLVFR